MAIDPKTHIAVVGPTGLVGREVLAALADQGHPAEKLTVLGSERSEGEELDYLDESVQVERATADAFRGVQLAIFATPAEVSRELAPKAQGAGAWVVDTSPELRLRAEAPLAQPFAEPSPLRAPFKGRMVCLPSPEVAALERSLLPLQAGGLQHVCATALVPASSAGRRGIDVLEKQTTGLLSGREPEPAIFPHRLAFNLLPQVGALGEGGWSACEASWGAELRRLWAGGEGAFGLSGTAVQVPVFHGTLLSVTVRLARPMAPEAVRERWRGLKGVKVLDAPEERVYPMPMLVTADPTVHVGRLRALSGDQLSFVAAIDNVGWTAAAAVAVGELLLSR